MLSLADAGGRLLFSYKDLAELAGYTSRIYALLSTLHRVHAGDYHKPKGKEFPAEWSLADIQGTVQEGYDGIRLEKVPIVAPAGQIHATGEVLIDEIDMIVRGRTHNYQRAKRRWKDRSCPSYRWSVACVQGIGLKT
jgi:ATP-binding cassette, subfamily D (ALD), peroxisomal long-chain fatty acid import protein